VSSSSTNKQPLLADRPLHEWAVLGSVPALIDPLNLSSLLAGGCVELVNCMDNDGAVVDSLSVIANQANTSEVRVIAFLSTSPQSQGISSLNTAAVASGLVLSAQAGQRTNISLPPLSVPVPNLGGMASPSETDKKGNGLYVSKGEVLYVGLNQPITLPTPINVVNVFAQGGYF
jgi:hypothetical protein